LYFYIDNISGMNLKNFLILCFLMLMPVVVSQTSDTINKTDKNGMKQGRWIKKYPNGHTQYNGYFKDNKPTGIFKRYFENDTLNSILIFSGDGSEALATLYHPNGFIASSGKFINQLKEGKWKFFSFKINGYLIGEEEYKENKRNGISVKFYTDSVPAEKITYINDLRTGEWTQYFHDGTVCLKAYYAEGKLHGSFLVFFGNGKPEYVGQYKDDARDGIWKIYNSDGSLKYNIKYRDGIAEDSEKFKQESDYLDTLEKNKGKIADPAITGTILE
jgi:antitoxin component YwqK of YwqJK toxin-antitoxin module